jgi:hypothetical protein
VNFILAIYLMVFWKNYLQIEIKFSFKFIFNVFCSIVIAFIYVSYLFFLLLEAFYMKKNKKEIYQEPFEPDKLNSDEIRIIPGYRMRILVKFLDSENSLTPYIYFYSSFKKFLIALTVPFTSLYFISFFIAAIEIIYLLLIITFRPFNNKI